MHVEVTEPHPITFQELKNGQAFRFANTQALAVKIHDINHGNRCNVVVLDSIINTECPYIGICSDNERVIPVEVKVTF